MEATVVLHHALALALVPTAQTIEVLVEPATPAEVAAEAEAR